MKKTLISLAAALSLTACTQRQNPFLTEWDTPYGIPPFDKIQIDDYIPAIEAGINEQNSAIEAIIAQTETPTFDNTIVPLELSGKTLSKIEGVLYNISETDRTDALDSVIELATPMMSEHSDNISFNKALFERVKAVFEADQTGLTNEQKMVLKLTYEGFERNGVGLPEEQQNRLKTINAELAQKQQKFGNNLLAENNAFKEKFGISISDYPNAMTTTDDRSLRQQMNEAYTSRGHNGNENDNRQLVIDIIALRFEKAKIMGYDTPAQYILADKMAHDPNTVGKFLADIMKPAVERAKAELADMQAVMDEDIKAGKLPVGSKIEPWDWWYYAEKVRKLKYDLDESETKPYFKLENVVKGAFLAAEQLYGIKMEKLDGMPAYNPQEVTTYKVTDADGSLIGIFTTDYMPRDSKRGGAWMNNVRGQYYDENGNDVRPIIVNVCNLEDYLTIDEVGTVFHEFGHALHGLLSKCHYPSVSGTSVKRDFVETFSQFNENWAFQPELLAQYAVNDKGEVIPAELIAKINNASQFNQGFMTTELCAASILDLMVHDVGGQLGKNVDFDEFEEMACRSMGLIPEIAPRYRLTYFNHAIGGGYSVGYYGYLWAEVLDKDAFSIFEASGNTFNKELARKFRSTFLEKGGSEEPEVLYEQFAGRQPDNTAFLKARGLAE